MPRTSGRANDQPRPISIVRHYTKHAEGSVQIKVGDTRVLCTASVEEKVPPFLRNKKLGWVTAEYSMLPRATTTRAPREASLGKQSGRSLEIQRLIGRTLRVAVEPKLLGERTITLDCDVLQADGSTRTAAISGAYVALVDAVNWLRHQGIINANPIQRQVAAISVGVVKGEVVCDLDYAEDSTADTDMNVVMDDSGGVIEIQATAEKMPFTQTQLTAMLEYAQSGVAQVFRAQQDALAQS